MKPIRCVTRYSAGAGCLATVLGAAVLFVATVGLAQDGPPPGRSDERTRERLPFGGPPGPGGFGAPPQERKILKRFDENKDGWLNDAERQAAKEFLNRDASTGGPPGPGGPRGRRGPGGPPGGPLSGGRFREPPQPGEKIEPTDVPPGNGPLYNRDTLRTLFLQFEMADWEQELEAFNDTDVDIPATLIVDGQTYPNVGVHFRGASSYFTVPRGFKRSLNVSLDFIDSKQRLLGYKTLNLLNCNGDPTFLRAVLYTDIAKKYIATPQTNFVRVVINGEDWGLYVSAQQFNKEFIAEHFPSDKGARWKVPGSPNARGGLEYLGENIDDYRSRYEIKSGDKEESWKRLIDLCKTLNETPIDNLATALDGKLDIDSTLWFLALDVGLVNSDGYWVRASDYNLYMDPDGKFYLIPHDVNETFSSGGGPRMGGPRGGGPGFRGPAMRERNGSGPDEAQAREDDRPKQGDDSVVPNPPRRSPPGPPPDGFPPGGFPPDELPPSGFPPPPGMGPPGMGPPGTGGVELDPLVGLDDPRKPLRSRLLQVPEFRERYLRNLRQLASEDLVWSQLEPKIAAYVRLIEPIVATDQKKLSTFEEFHQSLGLANQDDSEGSDRQSRDAPERGAAAPLRTPTTLKSFVERRREFLLNHPAIKNLKD